MPKLAGIWWLVTISLALALRGQAGRKRTDGQALADVAAEAAGIWFPLQVFLLSAFDLDISWKGSCRYEWMDCLCLGKLALTPLVLWACVSFRLARVERPDGTIGAWIPLGLFTGAVVSGLCFVHGLPVYADRADKWWLLVPLYVTIWYAVRCVQIHRAAGLNILWYLVALVGALPFWVLSILWSKRIYLSLPDNPTDCFVVTAASGGHESVVGPWLEIERGGKLHKANQQLLALWRFEALWRSRTPCGHAVFRRVYNRVGPHIARCIRTPLAADAVYLLLKPVELGARLVLRCQAKSPSLHHDS